MRGDTRTLEDVASLAASDNALAMRTGSLHGSVVGATHRMLSAEAATSRTGPGAGDVPLRHSSSRSRRYTPPTTFDPVESGAFTAGRDREGMPPLPPRGAQASVFVEGPPTRPPSHQSQPRQLGRRSTGFLQEASRSITNLSLGASQGMGRIFSREASSTFSDLPP